MKKDRLQIGDKVLVNNNAFDEQIETMEDSTTFYEVSETQLVEEGTKQWAKVKNGIKLIDIDTGEERIFTDWLHTAWMKKIK